MYFLGVALSHPTSASPMCVRVPKRPPPAFPPLSIIPTVAAVDFAGWNVAYGQFFNIPGSTRVARSTLAVAGLVDAEW